MSSPIHIAFVDLLREEVVSFEVPGVAVPKGRPRIATQGGMARAYTPKKTRTYESIVKLAAAEAMADMGPVDAPLELRVHVGLACPPSWSARRKAEAVDGHIHPGRRPDIDNLLKSIVDGCNDVVWTDDARIVDIAVSKRYTMRPHTRVSVRRTGGRLAK